MAHWEENFERKEQGQLKQMNPPTNKEENIYDTHRRVVEQWRRACEEAAAAHCRLAQAKDEMDKVSQTFYDYLQRQMTDPTVPQAPAVPGNGQAATQRAIPLPSRY